MIFTYEPYTVIPSFCELTPSCTSVSSSIVSSSGIACEDFTDGVLTQSFDSTDYLDNLAPGTYTFTFTVSTGGAATALNPTFDFKIILIDPCIQATVGSWSVSNQEYTISDES